MTLVDSTSVTTERYHALRAVSEVIGVDSCIRIEPIPPGLSGAVVFRARGRDGRLYAIKGWPVGTSPDRIGEVHGVMRRARGSRCKVVPHLFSTAAGKTVISSGRRYWEVAEWLPGAPAPVGAPPSAIEAGASAIARFHQAAAVAAIPPRPAPAVAVRRQRLTELLRILPEIRVASFAPPRDAVPGGEFRPGGEDTRGLNSAITAGCRLLGERWAAVHPQIANLLERFAAARVPLRIVLRDVHREHVLMGGTYHVSGLIDYDAVREDTPATDLARWIAGFLVAPDVTDATLVAGRLREGAEDRRWDQVWQAGLAGYRRSAPLTEQEEQLARRLLFASAWISLANWAVWLLRDGKRFPAGPEAIAGRIRDLTKLCRLLSDRDV
jgi:Ser/Thr protein kinase RdoA (MazF antagonist)